MINQQEYTGKKAVVIGGTHGMGLATVRRLMDGDAKVLLTGKNRDNVQKAQEELGTNAEVLCSDAAIVDEIKTLAKKIRESFGAIDFVFINAGMAMLRPFPIETEESYDKAFNLNARGAYFCAQQLAPLVKEGGSFVFTTSIANAGGNPGMSVYAGTKAALRSFVKGFAAELLPRKIRVNAVSPGFILTPTMGVMGLSKEELNYFENLGNEITPMKRHGTADEVAKAVLFLAFEATFTTGEELKVDGGLGQNIKFPR
ncbi:MAG: SDR family oxidoreductase [Chitinophagaceae bacterium]|nr:SDR family oxidoreductase [Chitinophagaceae bacterium]